MTRVFDVSAGPAVLPEPVLRRAAEAMPDRNGSGMSVMEMSRRGNEFMSIHAQALADLRELMSIPAHYRGLFMQGGALAQNAIVPMNPMGPRAKADDLVTGSWSAKSAKEAARYGRVEVVADTSTSARGRTFVPPQAEWTLSRDAAYLHVCTNETIDGVEFDAPPTQGDGPHEVPPGVRIAADVSSHVLSRRMDVSRFGVLHGGAQKNIGPAGLTPVIVREHLLGRAHPLTPSAFDYRVVAENDSMFSTPPTCAIYLAGAKDAGLLQLKGHRPVGGVRASIYDAMPIEGVRALVDYMRDFERRRG